MNKIEDLLNFIAESLLESRDSYKVTRVESDMNVLYMIQVKKNDLGRLIGKGGKTANAIRTLIYSCHSSGKRATVKFEEL
ncbi:MAG: KH domain-containing protein [Proteobacteria bacterium]|nr:KH domain-containing protein [Pseudomonadota bacterium]